EYYFLTTMVGDRIPLSKFSAIILTLPFDKLRNDGLRDDFQMFMNGRIRARLGETQIGRDILGEWDSRNKAIGDDRSSGLNGFAQKPLEDELNRLLDRTVPLWSQRGNLRTDVLVELYFLRNAALGIKPNTVRKIIRPRYVRNMQALDA